MPTSVSVERRIDAPPEVVFEIVSDPAAVARHSPELQRVRWLDGASGAAVGARFKGSNRNGLFRWSTVCTVTELEPPRCFAHDVSFLGRVMASWRFDLEPEGEGTRVVQTAEDRRPGWFARASVLGTGVADRPAANQDNARATLAAIAAQAEGVRRSA